MDEKGEEDMEVMIEVAMKIMKVEANNGDVGGGGFGDGGGVRKIGGIMKIVKSVKKDVLPKKKFKLIFSTKF